MATQQHQSGTVIGFLVPKGAAPMQNAVAEAVEHVLQHVLQHVVPLIDFGTRLCDWTAGKGQTMGKFRFIDLENDEEATESSSGEDSFAALLEAESSAQAPRFRDPRPQEKIQGTVMQRTKDSVFVDVGSKQPGVVSTGEYLDIPLPQVGDTVELFVRKVTGSEIELTRTIRSDGAAREELLAAKDAGTPVEARIEKAVNGGYQARIGQARAFIPISHMSLPGGDANPSPNPNPNPSSKPDAGGAPTDPYLGKTFPFHILEVKDGGRNIVLSRRTLLREELEESRRQCLASLVEGETRTVIITRLTEFGAFARLAPGLEGLIPMGELGWRRVARAADVVKEGESVAVKILSIRHSPQLRIGLSLKDAGADPWQLLAHQLQPLTQVEGTVSRLADFGAFVAVELGAEFAAPQGSQGSAGARGTATVIEGLVHVSELSWTRRIRHPGDVLKPGQRATFTVVKVEPDKRRLALSLRGPMPEELRLRAEAAARGGKDGQSAEDQELASIWRNYEAERQAQASGASSDGMAPPASRAEAQGGGTDRSPATSLAAAFASARKRPRA